MRKKSLPTRLNHHAELCVRASARKAERRLMRQSRDVKSVV